MDARSDAPITVVVAEHPRRSIRAYRSPGRVVWITVRPTPFLRLEYLDGYKRQAAVVVTIKF